MFKVKDRRVGGAGIQSFLTVVRLHPRHSASCTYWALQRRKCHVVGRMVKLYNWHTPSHLITRGQTSRIEEEMNRENSDACAQPLDGVLKPGVLTLPGAKDGHNVWPAHSQPCVSWGKSCFLWIFSPHLLRVLSEEHRAPAAVNQTTHPTPPEVLPGRRPADALERLCQTSHSSAPRKPSFPVSPVSRTGILYP